MKKLLLKIFLMMLVCMALVFALSQTVLRIMSAMDINISSRNAYYISLAAGLCGLILFAVLLNIFVVRRLKKLSYGVNEVTKGNYDVKIEMGGGDEIEKLIHDFNAMIDVLKSNEYMSREFVKNVSHELKTPLSSIMGYAELIQNEALSKEERSEYAAIIQSESKRLYGIGRQMLSISRLDSGSIVKRDDKFSPADQIREIILNMQGEWTKKNIDMEIDLQECEITGNSELSYHIWQNLISNAVKYSDDGGKIAIKLVSNVNLKFMITNSGDGIADKDKPFIFNQFYTASNCRGTGTGLGLAIVKKIVDKLDGNLSFKSESGATEFVVTLGCE